MDAVGRFFAGTGQGGFSADSVPVFSFQFRVGGALKHAVLRSLYRSSRLLNPRYRYKCFCLFTPVRQTVHVFASKCKHM